MQSKHEVLPVELLDDSPQNFFSLNDQEIDALAASIAAHGILSPLLVRPGSNGRYEIISGHRRKYAALRLGLREVPCEVRAADDVKAEMMLIDANLKTRELSPMEKARAIRRLKELYQQVHGDRRGRPGKNSKKNCGTEFHNSFGAKTRDLVASEVGLSGRQIDKYDRLNDLIPPLQELVDSQRLPLTVAVRLAQAPAEHQELLYAVLGDDGIVELANARAQELRDENERAYFVLQVLQQKITELTEQVADYERSHGERTQLKAELARLRQQKRELEYDLIDRENALKAVQSRTEKAGVQLLDLVERLCRPVQALRPDLEQLLRARPLDEGLKYYVLGWARVLADTAELLYQHAGFDQPQRPVGALTAARSQNATKTESRGNTEVQTQEDHS